MAHAKVRCAKAHGSDQAANMKQNLHQMNHEQRTQRMMMAGGVNGMNGMTPQQYGMMRIPNGMAKPTDLQRAAAMNNRNPYVLLILTPVLRSN